MSPAVREWQKLQNHLVSAVKVFTRHLMKSLIHDLKLFSKFLPPWESKCG